MVAAFLQRLLAGTRPSGRVSGPPTSSNGASSFHLAWEIPPHPLHEVRVDLEILVPPAVPWLYFWALQVGFSDGGRRRGGAHIGLQHHPQYPGSTAVNWGGYRTEGGELDGSVSELPSALGNVNTRDYRWQAGRRYRIRVFGPEPGRWRGTVTDLASGTETVVRDLLVPANSLVEPMVWSEVFAHCDHPPVVVRWSNLEADLGPDRGGTVRARTVRLNYQTHSDGGCANTSTERDPDGHGFVQRTGSERLHPTGTRLTLD